MEKTAQIVRAIRKALGETQVQFSQRVGATQAMVARWELRHKPNDVWMARLRKTAWDAGLERLVAELDELAERERVRPKIEVKTAEEVEQVNAVLRILRRKSEYPSEHAALMEITKRAVHDNAKVLADFQANADVQKAVVNLRDRGQSPVEIAEILSLPEETVTQVLSMSDFQAFLEKAGVKVK